MPGKGERVTIPSGIIVPVLVQKNNAFYDDPASGSVRVQSDGDVNFRFAFPENVKVDKMKIKWSTIMPSYIKYQQVPKGARKPVITKNTYTFFIYNAADRKWERTGNQKVLSGKLSDYIDGAGQAELKAQAVVNKKTPSQELLNVPDIEISGVVE
jgi:hypothetical protein